MDSEQINQIEQEAENAANEAGYPQSDKEQFTTTYWVEHNIFTKAYKAGALSRLKTIEDRDKRIADLENGLMNIIEWKNRATSTQDLFPVLQAIDQATQLLNNNKPV